MYASIHKSLNRLIHVQNLYIAIYYEENRLLRFPYYADELDGESYKEIMILKKKSLTGEVILSKKPLFLNETQLNERVKQGRIIGSIPKIWLGVPLISDESVIGVLAIQSYKDPDAFTKRDLDILVSVSHQIAVVIERKRIQEVLKENEERYRTLTEQSHDIIMRFDRSLKYLYVNSAIHQLGIEPNDLIGKTNAQLNFSKQLVATWETSIQKVFETGKVNRIEFKLPQGIWIDWLLCPEFTTGNEVNTVITFARDITQRKQMEFNNICYDKINKKIINSETIEQMLDGILDTMLDVFGCDRAYILFPCNPDAKLYSILFIKCQPKWVVEQGYQTEITKEISDILKKVRASENPIIYDPGSQNKIRPYLREKLSVKSQIVMPAFPNTGDAWEIGMHQCSHERLWTKPEARLFNGICQRITDGLSNMLLFRELKQTKNYIDSVLNSMPSLLMGVDADGKITQWNHQAQIETGVKSKAALGKYFYHFFPHLNKFIETIKVAIDDQKVIEELKVPHQIKDKTIYENITIYPIKDIDIKGVVIRVDDVTNQIQIEEMMIQSEKMLSVGGLAAGMAHEINNPLAGMMQNAQLVLNRLTKKIPRNDEIAKEAGTSMDAIHMFMDKRNIINQLQHINDAGKCAAHIVENMLSFAKKAEGSKSYENLPQLLDRTFELAHNDYDLKTRFDFKQIIIKKKGEKEFPPVFCEYSKIQQVFFNIIKNGAEAMHSLKDQIENPPEFIIQFFVENKMAVITIK
ncbi:MAG: PAS domain S-box protein, partial [Bacteroidetes bacterium]|nr:PAS domain S-box protein [Bacteroidota bacterium]